MGKIDLNSTTGKMLLDDVEVIDLNTFEQSKIFSQKTDIPDVADLNSYVLSGMYHQPSSVFATNGTNYPSANAGMLTVKASGAMVYQEYHSFQSNEDIWYRTKFNTTWNSWKKVLNETYAPRMQLMTAQNSTSGTAIDFTGIPSWAKKITVMFNSVSTSGTSHVLIQVGSGSVNTSGYLSTASWISSTSSNTASSTAGFILAGSSNATDERSGAVIMHNFSSNTWMANGNMKNSTTSLSTTSGNVSLSGTLDRIRITTINGTDTFDAGQINVLYEG